MLRTKAMREKEEQKARRKYKYCLIRYKSLFCPEPCVLCAVHHEQCSALPVQGALP